MPDPIKFKAAYLAERGVYFAVIQVSAESVETEYAQREAARFYKRFFPEGTSIILMALKHEGSTLPATFYGRRDLVAFMSALDSDLIKWKIYTYS